jgi:hypothetical protein
MTVYEAMAQVMADVRSVAKTEKHGQGWSFRGIDAVVNAVGPAARHHGLVLVPRVLDHHAEILPTGTGKSVRSVTVTVEYTFVGPGGDSVAAVSVGEAMDNGDKATAKAMSVALRTCLLQTFLLPTDDPDPDHDVYEVAQPASPVTAFDATSPSTWPDRLTIAEAKQVVLHTVGGNRSEASKVWDETFADWNGYPVDDVMEWVVARSEG